MPSTSPRVAPPEARVIVVIPARLAASRLPGKPLADLQGLPLVERVRRLASQARSAARVLVATPDPEIAEVVRGFGGEVVLTGEAASGTDRVHLALPEGPAWVVNVQGDQPGVDPAHIDRIAALLVAGAPIATLACPRPPGEGEPAMVGVRVDAEGRALSFARLPSADHPLLHLGLYGFQREVLAKIAALPPHPDELRHGLEQLRWLAAGFEIRVGVVDGADTPIDTPAQLAAWRARLRPDPSVLTL